MDLSEVNDIKELKSLAYDQLVQIDQLQTNIRLINQRIEQLKTQSVSEPEKTKQPEK